MIGNPPFLSQMAASTTRGGSSRHGGGPYADAAVEFLALAAELVDPAGGRVALVLPQSLLASRDAAAIRGSIDERARMIWSWWSGGGCSTRRCTCAWSRSSSASRSHEARRANWSHVVTSRQGVPAIPGELHDDGCLGDRAQLNANFHDEYYGMVPAVGDHATGPRLITCGLIDPARSWWGDRPITFAEQRYERPRVDLDRARRRHGALGPAALVPKVLVANQTTIVEAVCDPAGEWLPAVPVLGVYPDGRPLGRPRRRPTDELVVVGLGDRCGAHVAVASAWLWHRGAGTGLSADSIRLSPVTLGELPWPGGDLGQAVEALRAGDVRGCSAAVARRLRDRRRDGADGWWTALLERIETAATVDGVNAGGCANPAIRRPSTAGRGRPVRSRGSARRAVCASR